MRLETNSPDRKELAQEISEWIQEPVRYDGPPSMTYSIGLVKIERGGVITCEDTDVWAALTPFFQNHGWLGEADSEAETEAGAEQEEPITESITVNSVSIPAGDFTAQSAANLLRMIYTRQDMLNAMTRGNTIFVDAEVMGLLHDTPPETMEAFQALLDSETAIGMIRGIGFADGKLTVDFPFDAERSTDWQHFAKLMFALADKAKSAHRVSAKRITPGELEMKYFCNSLLNQLDFGGVEHKELRHVLLGHLPGYAAFKNEEKMNAHKAKYTERRREFRRSEEEARHEEN